jgi:SecD/SecF fusion protein
MQKNTWWQWLILAAAVIGSIAIVTPPFDTKDSDGNVVKHGKIKFGLDLQGGTSFIVEVDRDELRSRLRERSPDLTDEQIEATIAKDLVASRDVALEAIRNRIDGLGIAEPQIYPQMDDRIVVQMPGIDAKKRDAARKSIQSVAFLEFRLVHKDNDAWIRKLDEADKAPRGFAVEGDGAKFHYVRDLKSLPDEKMDAAYWSELRRFAPREGAEFMLQRDEEGEIKRAIWRPVYVERAVMLSGKAVDEARMDFDNLNRPQVDLKFTKPGARQFTEIIRRYRPNGEMNRDNDDGRQLAIILDGALKSAPEITDKFPHDTTIRNCEISGRGMDVPEVKQLVNVLKTGALLAPMRIAQESTVDPTLGKASVESGGRAALIGMLAVAAFMLIYYLVPGIVANLALLLNAVLLPLGMICVAGILAVFARASGTPELPTLTLPGIAGIALMFGMAVDANVLIYERMREELKAGKHLVPAIEAGYSRAFVTIVDSNLTTVLAAVIMFWQGSGPIRGYAITLTAGILVSMYTAIVVTRMAFNLLASRGGLKSLKMLEWIKPTSFNFVGWRKVAIGASLAVIVGSWTMFAVKGEKNFGVDFIGGTSLTLEYAQKVDDGKIRSAFAAAGVQGDPLIQYQELGAGTKRLNVQVRFEDGEKAEQALGSQFADAGFKVVQKEEIGPQIGKELKTKGLYALLWSLVGMVIYISIRFEFGFAIGAMAALVHDALISVGIFCLLGRQLSAPMIAVVLTIIGYSVNDTIVVFDRIREGLKLWRGKSYFEVANIAINQTLSRTLLTAGTTILSALALFVFGGGAINDFALLLLIGLVVGTYSSVFIATPVMLLWHGGNRTVTAPAPAGKPGKNGKPAKATA